MTKEQLEELSNRVKNKRLSFESSVPLSLEDIEFLINAAIENERLRAELEDVNKHRALYHEKRVCQCGDDEACAFVADRDKLRILIKDFEWCSTPDFAMIPDFCPYCRMTEDKGHSDYCLIKEVLK